MYEAKSLTKRCNPSIHIRQVPKVSAHSGYTAGTTVFAHPELRSGGSCTSTLRRHSEHKKYGGSKSRQALMSQFEVVS